MQRAARRVRERSGRRRGAEVGEPRRGAKERLTVTVDAELIEAGNRSVAEGKARSLSSWVNPALADRVAEEQGLRAMAEAVADYEAEHGVITAEEMAEQRRRDREQAIVVRGRRRTGARRARGRALRGRAA